MFKFTIRELLLMTLVAALGTGWWITYRELARTAKHAEIYREELQDQLDWREHESGIALLIRLENGEEMESNTERTFFPTNQ